MTGLQIAHLVFLGMWGGTVLAELVMELVPRARPALWPATVRFHYWIDLLVELPIVAGVVATGALLLRDRTMDGPLAAKVLAGLGAALANVICAAIVIRRARLPEGSPAWPAHHQGVLWSAGIGVPLGLAALAMGGARAGWW